MTDKIIIRPASISDLNTIVGIYNQAILSKKATAHLSTFTADQRKDWFLQFNNDTYPIYVAEVFGNVVGYATLSPYRNGRKALQKVAEISFYVDNNSFRRGVGSKLVQHLISDCKRVKKETLLAILLDVNTSSIALLQKFYFEEWGNLPLKSDFEGKRYNHLIYGLNLENG